MLQLQLKQLDHFHRRTGRTGNSDTGMAIGGEDLFNRAMTDDVARCGPAIPCHHNAIDIANRYNSGGMGDRQSFIDCGGRGHWDETLHLG